MKYTVAERGSARASVEQAPDSRLAADQWGRRWLKPGESATVSVSSEKRTTLHVVRAVCRASSEVIVHHAVEHGAPNDMTTMPSGVTLCFASRAIG